MNYKEEQDTELEALESIYCGELEVLGTDPHRFTIRVKSEQYDTEEGGLACTLKFTFTPKYPDEVPEVEILDTDNFLKSYEGDLENKLLEDARDNLSMAMIFTLVSSAQDWLNNKWDELKKDKEMEAERRLRESEEAERIRFEGTQVTVETFMTWKKAFEEEMGILKKNLRDEREGKKLTGRELFLQDQSLIESDLKFLEDNGEAVKVDESLFEDFDELDLVGAEFSDEEQ